MIVKLMGKNQENDTYEILYWSTTASSLIRWIKKHPNINNVKKKYDNPLTDDLHVEFEYKEFKFLLESPYADYWIQCKSEDCPKGIIHDFINYLKEKKVSIIRNWFVNREYKKRKSKGY